MTAPEADPADRHGGLHAAGHGGEDIGEDVAAMQRYGSALLRRAVEFGVAALDELPPIAPSDLARPTPCADWDLHISTTRSPP
jgi:hypothetical protein